VISSIEALLFDFGGVLVELSGIQSLTEWLRARLIEYQPILHEASQAYLGYGENDLAARPDQAAGLAQGTYEQTIFT